MIEFVSLDKLETIESIIVFVVEVPGAMKAFELIGELVTIDGDPYRVLALERFDLPMGNPEIGDLVADVILWAGEKIKLSVIPSIDGGEDVFDEVDDWW